MSDKAPNKYNFIENMVTGFYCAECAVKVGYGELQKRHYDWHQRMNVDTEDFKTQIIHLLTEIKDALNG